MAVPCPRCGGELDRAIGSTFSHCPYCGAAVVRVGDAGLERYLVPKRLAPEAARRALDRWMVGNEPSRWLASGAEIGDPVLAWLPVWYARTGAAKNIVAVQTRADGVLVPEVKRRLVPPSGMRRLDGQSAPDEILPEPTIAWADFARDALAGKQVVERSLVHVPFYRFTYRYRGRRYTAAVDAATGEVRPGRYPKRPAAPFVVLSLATIAIFAIADLWWGGAWWWDADRPHLVPYIYPLAWLAIIGIARLVTAVF